jgi:hypothetical protein
MVTTLTLGLVLGTAPAHAASCDALAAQADRLSGTGLADGFKKLASCDKQLAEDSYVRFMSKATDADALVALSNAAIDADVWNPVWQQLGKISDYDARDTVARELGASCAESEKMVSFLQGAYFGLRDIDFSKWNEAFVACDAPGLISWTEQQVSSPPNRVFDDKFNALMSIFVQKRGVESLPVLADAAAKAAEGGPFDAILIKMDEAVAPPLGKSIDPGHQAKLEESLVKVARGVAPDKARAVADRLANAGSESAAAKLLPAVYPDRVQNGGGFLYGGASVELGECKGEKTAVIHIAEVREPGRRWLIAADANALMRGFKPRLSKCDAESGDWPVAFTAEPVADDKEIDAWASQLEKQWTEKGYAVKVQAEKDVSLN